MINSFKIGILSILVFWIPHIHAGTVKDRCKDNINACGIVFTSIPTTPNNLSTANCFSPLSLTYVIENEGMSDTFVDFGLANHDSLGSDAVTIDNSSTCINGDILDSLASCNIVLQYEPCNAGNLDRDLIVSPSGTQRPLVLGIQTNVTSSAFVYCEGP